MSPLWLDRLRAPVTLHLSAREISVRGGSQQQHECLQKGSGDEAAWRPSLQAAERHLAALRLAHWQRRARVVVGNDLVRYVVLPWTEQRLDDKERHQYVHMLFEEHYGKSHDACAIAVEAPRFGMPALAAAIDNALIVELQAMLARCKLRMSSLVPALAERIDDLPTKAATAGWLVDTSDGQLEALAFANGKWLRVSSRRHADESALHDSLFEILRRDAIAFPALLDGKVWLKDAAAVDGMRKWTIVPVASKA